MKKEIEPSFQFYKSYPIRDAMRPKLSWTHYLSLLRDEMAFSQFIKGLLKEEGDQTS